MSALLQGIPGMQANDGVLYITLGTTAPNHVHNGIPYEADGSVAFTAEPPSHYHQGLGFSAVGRISRQNAIPDYFGSGAAPFNTLEPSALSLGGTPVRYSNGVGYDADSKVAITAGTPPFFFDFDQSDFLAGDFA